MFSLHEDFLSDMSSSLNCILFVVFFSFIDRIASFDADLSRSIKTSLDELPASLLLLSPRFLSNNVTKSQYKTYEACLLIVHKGFLSSVCCSACYISLKEK